jgi:hypothetical protein
VERARVHRRRLDREIRRELDRTGAGSRLELCRQVLGTRPFAAQLQDAITWAELSKPLSHVDQLRDLALAVLASMGCKLDGVSLKIRWEPGEKAFEIRAVFAYADACAAVAKVKERHGREMS